MKHRIDDSPEEFWWQIQLRWSISTPNRTHFWWNETECWISPLLSRRSTRSWTNNHTRDPLYSPSPRLFSVSTPSHAYTPKQKTSWNRLNKIMNPILRAIRSNHSMPRLLKTHRWNHLKQETQSNICVRIEKIEIGLTAKERSGAKMGTRRLKTEKNEMEFVYEWMNGVYRLAFTKLRLPHCVCKISFADDAKTIWWCDDVEIPTI